jgi:NADH-quinone oxidoreductase subunit J
MTAVSFFIYLFGAVAVVGALGMLVQRNPIIASLSLAVSFLAVAGIFAALEAHFLALIQIIVYTGLIQVLIIYTIMLMDLTEEDIKRKVNFARILGAFAGAALLAQIVWGALRGPLMEPAPIPEGFGTMAGVAEVLFGRYLLAFEVVAFLLLAGMVAAVWLARSKQPARGKSKISETPTPLDSESSINPRLIKR